MVYSSNNDIAVMLKAIRVVRQDLNKSATHVEDFLSASRDLTPEQFIHLRGVLRDLKMTSNSVDELLDMCHA